MNELLHNFLMKMLLQADDGSGSAGGGSAEPNLETKPGSEPKVEPKTEPKTSTTSDAEAKLLKELMGLKTKLAEKDNALKSFEGIDPEAVRSLLADKAKAEEEALRKAGEWDKLKERIVQEHQRETTAIQAKITEMAKANEKLSSTITELTVGSSFVASKFLTEETVLPPSKARAIYGSHFDVEDGKVVGYDAPRGSENRTPLVDGRGIPMPFDEAMRRIVESDADRDRVLRSKAKTGTGVSSSSLPGTTTTPPANTGTGLSRIAASLAGGALSTKK